MRTLLLVLAVASSAYAAATLSPDIRYFDPARPVHATGPDRISEIEFPLILRIGLEEKQESVSLTCPKPFRILYGDKVQQSGPQERWTFRIREGVAAEIEYLATVKTHHWTERQKAEQEVAGWKARGYAGARVDVRGALLQNNGNIIHDNRDYMVVVSASTDLAQTEEALKELQALGERPFVVEKLLKEPQGIVELTGPGGRTIVSRGPFEVIGDNQVKVFQVEHDVGYPWHGRQDRDYAGTVILMVDRWGKLVVINKVEMEKYLRGVVPCEIEADAPLEAQKTQAVSARGETLAGYGIRHPADPYDFEASQKDQQYAGITKETPLASQAVEVTRGEILKANTHITETVYAANCGGHTEDAHNVWSTSPNAHLQAVPDAEAGVVPSPVTTADLESFLNSSPDSYCRDPRDVPTNKYRWKTTISAADVDKFVANKGHKIGKVLRLEPLGRGRSGRLKSLKVVGEKGEIRVDKELPIRQLLGGLKSAMFLVKAGPPEGGRPSSWLFTGGGWGHGVGMCQMGARGMARAGKDYTTILTRYFSNTSLVDLY